MEPVTTTYYCIKAAVSIGKFALDFQKARSLNEKNLEIQNIKTLNESIKDYLGLIRNDVQSLMHMYFKSAYENLEYALNAHPDCKREYLVQARNRFIDAGAIEKNDNLILSYLGLSLCQNLLGDSSNSLITINRIKEVDWADIYLNNADDILKGWKDPFWINIFVAMQIRSCFYLNSSKLNDRVQVAFDNMFSQQCERASMNEDRKFSYHRRFDAIKKCGGFSMNESFYTICIKAEKLILKEDFYRLKQAVIDAFNL